jgi:VWFA-related protein
VKPRHRRRRAWRWGGLPIVLATAAGIAAAQVPPGQPPVFRSGVTLVELSALVTGDGNRPLTDLTAADFEVFEDGERRPLVSVRHVSVAPTEHPPPPAAAVPGRAEQIVGNTLAADAPAFVLLLDDLNVSPYDSHRAIRAGLGVVGAVPREALLAVVTTSGEGGALLTLTSPSDDHATLVKSFRGRFLLPNAPPNPHAPQTTGSSVDAPCGVGSAADQSADCGDPTRAARRAAAVEAVGRLLARAGSRRKVLFWLTTDMGVSPLDPNGNRAAQVAALHGVLGGDVTVYPVDPRENYAALGVADRRTGGRMRVGTSDTVFQGRGGSTMTLATDEMVAVPLSEIARETGGRWIQWTNDLETALARVVEQNSSAYVLAFESASSSTPGRHRIDVKVRRRGARVSARRAYVVPTVAAPPQVEDGVEPTAALLQRVLQGAVSQGRLLVRAHVAPQFATGASSRVLVTLSVDPLTAGDSETVAARLVVFDDRGRLVTGQGITIARPPHGSAMEGSISVLVPPGRHQLRVAAATADRAHTGLVVVPLDVPVPGERLALGVPVLLAQDAAGVRPTLQRAFALGHPLAVQCEVASPDAATSALPVRARLVSRDGTVVREALSRGDGGQGDPVRTVTLLIETSDVSAGNYRLVIDVPGTATRPPDGHVVPIDLLAGDAGESLVPPSRTHALQPLPVAHGPLTRHAHRGPLVIRTEEAWAAFWKALPTRRRPPDIDFARATLVAIVSEDDGAAPAAPRIESVHTEPGGILVRWRHDTAGSVTMPHETERPRPFVVVGLPGLHGQVRFERVE